MKKEWIITKVTKKRFTIIENKSAEIRELQVLKLDNVSEVSYYSDSDRGEPTLDNLIIKMDDGREILAVIPQHYNPDDIEFYEAVRSNFNRLLDK